MWLGLCDCVCAGGGQLMLILLVCETHLRQRTIFFITLSKNDHFLEFGAMIIHFLGSLGYLLGSDRIIVKATAHNSQHCGGCFIGIAHKLK